MQYKTRCLFIGLIWIIGALALLLWLSGCAHRPLKWTAEEKALAGTFVALQAADIYQTDKATTTDDYKEANPVVASITGEEARWQETVPLTIAVDTLLFWGIHRIPKSHDGRMLMLSIANSITLVNVINNERVAGGIIFGGDF